ncbi:uncharacterized protein LOC122884061 [Siniperca chuatsi]|uniref:uncharacterized protein LOC122884061 n=1 Tax=Siniperca chuatsi TaxID=119488 RepID=UPI001CE042B2|nr:uncharacterized protein LOC122884061 [Siniperca chuatsi]
MFLPQDSSRWQSRNTFGSAPLSLQCGRLGTCLARRCPLTVWTFLWPGLIVSLICTFSGAGQIDHRLQAQGDKAGQKRQHTPPWQTQERLMCLLLHPGFISTIHRTRLWSNDGAANRVQFTDCHHSSMGLDVTLVHCYFTGQFVRDQDGNPTAAPEDVSSVPPSSPRNNPATLRPCLFFCVY